MKIPTDLRNKMEKLETILKGYGKLLVAFSGGVDSTFLLAMARKVLKDNVVAVTGDSPIHSTRETKDAVSMAQKMGVKQIIHETQEMTLPEFLKNPEDRCYICKKHLIQDLKKIADKMNIPNIAHGANKDDLGDYRPGFAAAEEMGVLSPLIEAGMTKADIRELSKEMGLETWDKPSMPCLATRLPYGTSITKAVVKQIEAAENILFDLGFKICRVRHHGDLARIEIVSEDFNLILDNSIRKKIVNAFKELGYLYVSLDMEGYLMGSMNRAIDRVFGDEGVK